MSTKVKNLDFLVIFDTCDVVYNLSVSLLPPFASPVNSAQFLTIARNSRTVARNSAQRNYDWSPYLFLIIVTISQKSADVTIYAGR